MSDKISKEIEQLADKMEKSASSMDAVKETIKALGPEGLKKAFPNLSIEQKTLLFSVLEDMKKSHTDPIMNPEYTTEPVINTTPNGDYLKNEARMDQDEQDEKVMAEAEKDKSKTHRNQGGVPVEGWEGQIIKAEGAKPASAASEMNPMGGATTEPLMKKKKKSMMKSMFKAIISRMQERKLEKSACIDKLSDEFKFEKSKIEAVWDTLAKAESYKYDDGSKGSDLPEADQSKQPEDKKSSEPKGDEPSVPVYKDKHAENCDCKDCYVAKQHKTTADSGENPPLTKAAKPSKKKEEEDEKKEEAEEEASAKKIGDAIDDLAEGEAEEATKEHEEEMHSKKNGKNGMAKSNPFTHRKIGQNAHYRVDQYLANEYVENFKKSKFDWETTENFQKACKSENPSVEMKGVKKKDKKKNGVTVNSPAASPMMGGPNAMVVKAYDINDLIEAQADMDSSLLKSARDVYAVKDSETAFLVKSFDDSAMDALFEEQDYMKNQDIKEGK